MDIVVSRSRGVPEVRLQAWALEEKVPFTETRSLDREAAGSGESG